MYTLVEVNDELTEKAFIELPVKLYKDSPNWIRPLDGDIKKVFDKDKNPCFREGGECVRWLLKDNNNNYIGRVAAFINSVTYKLDSYSVGQMGFFECINNKDAAFVLFEKCEEWIREKGMDAMEGPVNFGQRMEWWGLLTDGFDEPPVYMMPYTHDYYVAFFEAYGFKDYYKQFTLRTVLSVNSMSKIIVWKSDRLLKNPDYKVLSYGDIGKERAIDALLEVYNKAWNLEVHGVNNITREQVNAIYKNLQPIIDKDIIFFAFHKDQPIGFFFMMPEINEAIKHVNGKLDFMGIAKFMYHLKVKKIKIILGQLFGVVPEFQGRGIEAVMIKKLVEYTEAKKRSYGFIDLNWIGDFNPQMLHLMEYIGAKPVRTHVTYRKILKEGIEFCRSIDKVKQEA